MLPNIKGLRNLGESRVNLILSNDKLSWLMVTANQIAGMLNHLQGIVGNLQTVQAQEAACRLIAAGELDSTEELAIQVAQLSLDEDFDEDGVDMEGALEDFGEN